MNNFHGDLPLVQGINLSQTTNNKTIHRDTLNEL